MGQPTNTYDSYDAKGNREDLADVIYRVAQEDTPVQSSIGKTKAKATLHEWQTQALAAPSITNFVIEGDDAVATDAATATTRLTNYTCISDKIPLVTGTQMANESAGRGNDEMAYQVMLKGIELAIDKEGIIQANNAKVAGDDSTARECAGMQSYLVSNVSAASDGTEPTDGSGAYARVAGTARAFKESHLKAVLRSIADNGGKPDCIFADSFNREAINDFSGGATRMQNAGSEKIVATIDVYKGPFSTVKVKYSPQTTASVVLVLDTSMWAVAHMTGREMKKTDLPATGDYSRKHLLSEYTLESRNEKSSGIIADLTTS